METAVYSTNKKSVDLTFMQEKMKKRLENIKIINARVNEWMLLTFISATIFLVLNSTEGFAEFVNQVYEGVVFGKYSLLDVYKCVHP